MKLCIINIATTGLDPAQHGILCAHQLTIHRDSKGVQRGDAQVILIDPGDIEIEPHAIALHKASGLFAGWRDAKARGALTPIAAYQNSLRDAGTLVLGQGGWALPWLGNQRRYIDPVLVAETVGLEYPKIDRDAQGIEALRLIRDADLMCTWLRLFTIEPSAAPQKPAPKTVRPVAALE